MSEANTALSDSARRFFTAGSDAANRERMEQGRWPDDLWRQAVGLGFTDVARSEDRGGHGFDMFDVASVIFEAGRAGVPLPVGEAVVAELMLAAAGLPNSDGFAAPFAAFDADRIEIRRSARGLAASGTLREVPWGRHAARVVAIASLDNRPVTVILPATANVETGTNLADEPRDTLTYDDVAVENGHVGAPGAGMTLLEARAAGTWMRAAALSGVMDSILEIAIGYTKDRVQFGRPIAAFQAVQQQMAVLASQAAAAAAAVSGATAALAAGGDGLLEVALAKARAGEAAGVCAAIAHQVHGAIGFTKEYRLQFGTRRIWAWREEYGSDGEWATVAGAMIAAAGSHALWPRLVAAETI